MPQPIRQPLPRWRKSALALAACAALSPYGASAIDLAQSPPGTTEPYVAPNVIISIDDSGSMDWQITNTSTGLATITAPNPDGSWDSRAKRMTILRYALRQVFSDTALLPDRKIRLSWQAMWNNGNAPNARSVDSTTMNTNSMRVLAGTHRSNFLSFVNGLTPSGGTPAHIMFSQADAYMRRPLGINSPWASEPGVRATPYLGCRRNYHIFMTDGRWNGTPFTGGQQDGVATLTLPDGTVYADNTAAQRAKTQLYRDAFSNTLADWAFFSWSNPLQVASSLTGAVQPKSDYRRAPATESFGRDAANREAVLDRYWNPRYNPATWAHMVTYTIGFSTDATTWPGAPTITAPTERVPFGYDGSFPDLVTGNRVWPDMANGGENIRALDLWHAALNGRGRFYSVMRGEDLEKAFREIIGQINTQTDPDLTSSATSGSNTSRNDVGKFTAAYEPQNAWKGFVIAETVQRDGSTVPASGWGGRNTADKLDDASFNVANRFVLSWSDKWETSRYRGGVPFKWAADETFLSNGQKTWLQRNISGVDQGATPGQQRLNYVRGDRSLEGSESTGYTAARPYRERRSRQGDIINSVVWYTGAPSSNYALKGYAQFTRDNRTRPPMIYVGGNDGMLHGFLAADGTERLAYVPKGVIPTLTNLTDPSFNSNHRYYVDGSPMTGDVDLGVGVQDPDDPSYDPTYTSDWRTLLVGTLGNGGKGYFVLDVTNPTTLETPGGPPAWTEANAQKLVRLDRTRGASEPDPNCAASGLSAAERTACVRMVDEDADIGHITARPVVDDTNAMRTTQITRLNNNRWAVVMGNGYNSRNQRPVLLIQYLDGAQELLRIPVTNDAAGSGRAADNGLSAPRLVDLNGDGRPDVVYAGDNLGNLWKFDMTAADASNWRVAFGGSPLFSAKGPAALGNVTRNVVQPISVAPVVRTNDRTKTVGTGASARTVSVGGMMVAFGTGRNVGQRDPENIDVQTLYSVLDNTRYRVVNTTLGKRLEVHPGAGTCPAGADCIPAPQALGDGVSVAKLAQQKVTDIPANDGFSTVDVVQAIDWNNFNGWYLDFPAVGERLLKPLEFYDSSNVLVAWSQVPAKGSNVDPNVESCDSVSVDEERQYRTLINIMDGKRPTVQILDINGDGIYNAVTDKGASRARVAKGAHTLIAKRDKIVDLDARNNATTLARMPEQSVRPSWRQLK